MARITRQNPNAFNVLNKRIKELYGKQAKAGWFESSVYENGTPVAYVATIQEFGSPEQSIPPRPFMRPTVDENKKSWRDIAMRGAKAILAGVMDAEKVMDLLGLQAVKDVSKKIASITTPPLSPITLELRKMKRDGVKITGATVGEAARRVASPDYVTPDVSTKPLVDDGIMLNSLTHKVEDTQ